jgi:predicted AAA+ superfamily ATPase
VGKTTAVQLFSAQFDQYLYLNLRKTADRVVFRKSASLRELAQAVFLLKKKDMGNHDTLIFIDEVEEYPKALALLRYLYESYPQYCVVAAESFLGSLSGSHANLLAEGVEYKMVRPFSFREFLEIMDKKTLLQQYESAHIESCDHDKLLKLFHDYTLIGGMPEVVDQYVKTRDVSSLETVYDSILLSYLRDVRQYAPALLRRRCIRHILRVSFYEAGKRIRFKEFGQLSCYPENSITHALQAIERAMIIRLYYPTIQSGQPYSPDVRKMPELQVLDTGMMNYFTGFRSYISMQKDLNELSMGRVSEHVVGQELMANREDPLQSPLFWVRGMKMVEPKASLFPFGERMIPVETKSGPVSVLFALQQYMNVSDETIAIRLYAGEAKKVVLQKSSGKMFELHSLPYYLAGNLATYLNNLPG